MAFKGTCKAVKGSYKAVKGTYKTVKADDGLDCLRVQAGRARSWP